jgi:hypothetical protein
MLTAVQKFEVAVVLLGAGLAVWASTNPALFALGGGLAAAAAAALGLSTLRERLRESATVLVPTTQTMDVLRKSFRATSLGRQTVVATLAMLDREFRGRGRPLITPEEERRVATVGPSEFRAWVEARLSELERET